MSSNFQSEGGTHRHFTQWCKWRLPRVHFVRLHGSSRRRRGLHRLYGANHKRRGTHLQGRSGLGEVHKRFFKPGPVSNLCHDIQRITICTGSFHIRCVVGEHQHTKWYGRILHQFFQEYGSMGFRQDDDDVAPQVSVVSASS